MDCQVREVSGTEHAQTLHRLNALSPNVFPPLRARHLAEGFWWLIIHRGEPKAFAGMVPMPPFHTPTNGVGYLKRCWVDPKYRGRGWQKILLEQRERKAKSLGWTMLVSDVSADNEYSNMNFLKSGYTETVPEQIWASNSRFWVKVL